MALWQTKKQIERFRAYKFFWESPEGKFILSDMADKHHVFDGGFDPDPYVNAFHSGERNPVLRIFTILKLTAEEIAALVEED